MRCKPFDVCQRLRCNPGQKRQRQEHPHSHTIWLRRSYEWKSLLARGTGARSAHVAKAAREPDRYRISGIPFAADIDRDGKCRIGADGWKIIKRCTAPRRRTVGEG